MQGRVAEFPSNPAPYLVEWLFEIGPSTGDGILAMSELAAWENITGIELSRWEARTLRRLSGDYLHQRQESREPGCPAPYSASREASRSMVTRQFAAMAKAIKSGS